MPQMRQKVQNLQKLGQNTHNGDVIMKDMRDTQITHNGWELILFEYKEGYCFKCRSKKHAYLWYNRAGIEEKAWLCKECFIKYGYIEEKEHKKIILKLVPHLL